jgi:hypothetical protein
MATIAGIWHKNGCRRAVRTAIPSGLGQRSLSSFKVLNSGYFPAGTFIHRTGLTDRATDGCRRNLSGAILLVSRHPKRSDGRQIHRTMKSLQDSAGQNPDASGAGYLFLLTYGSGFLPPLPARIACLSATRPKQSTHSSFATEWRNIPFDLARITYNQVFPHFKDRCPVFAPFPTRQTKSPGKP